MVNVATLSQKNNQYLWKEKNENYGYSGKKDTFRSGVPSGSWRWNCHKTWKFASGWKKEKLDEELHPMTLNNFNEIIDKSEDDIKYGRVTEA